VLQDPNQWKNLAADARYKAVREELGKWLPRTNAPHYREKRPTGK
jgi:hypothetical protein